MISNTMNIFIVDDSMFIVTQLKQILEKGGHQVCGYANRGEDALQKMHLHKEKLDLVTIDITMPGNDGIWVLEQIKQQFPGIMCCIISAIGKKETVLTSRKLGAEGYIIKPLSTEKVLGRLQQLSHQN